MSDSNHQEKTLLLEISPLSFFQDKVITAQERQQIKLSQDVEFYVVNMLCDFLRSDENLQTECLALSMQKAFESSFGERVLIFKKLGDTALFFAGFFQNYFANKNFDIGYYVTMGSNAYGELSNLMRRKRSKNSAMVKMYRRLAREFVPAVDILNDVSEHTVHQNLDRTTLSLYDAWLDTASEKLERELFERGVNPVRVSKKAAN